MIVANYDISDTAGYGRILLCAGLADSRQNRFAGPNLVLLQNGQGARWRSGLGRGGTGGNSLQAVAYDVRQYEAQDRRPRGCGEASGLEDVQSPPNRVDLFNAGTRTKKG